MSVEYQFQNCGFIRRRHSFRQVWFKSAVDCMRTEKNINANKCLKTAYSSVAKKIKKRNPRADPDHHQKSTTSRGSPLACACQVWSTSVSAFVSYPVYRMTERMTENDHITSALLTEVIIIIIK